jgi:uncharacterized 2Fe-2S/4Fe-4S cluster protein (DUF4445 family)
MDATSCPQDFKSGATLQVRVGDKPVLLSEAALAAGINLELHCGGNGVCGGCMVEWESRLVPACQTFATHDGLLRIPASAAGHEHLAVESAFSPPFPRPAHPRCKRFLAEVPALRQALGMDDWERVCRAAFDGGKNSCETQTSPLPRPRISLNLLRKLPDLLAETGSARRTIRLTVLDGEVIELADAAQPAQPVAGLAIDVGTTTVVVRLLDLSDGKQLALAGARNRQASLGANVISRISQAASPSGLKSLQELLIEKTLLPLIERCLAQAGLRSDAIQRAVIGGNTVMTHLFLGLNPTGLGVVPFNAVALEPGPTPGSALGLPAEQVECLPASSAYIGGDALGGVYAVGLDRAGPPELLIDIGTNSEMILRAGGKLYATSAAAGPAFEGGELSCGGPAAPGAITHINFSSGFQIETYQDTKPTHLCGSACVDFLAEGRKHGFLDEKGHFDAAFLARFGQPNRQGNVKSCEVAPGVVIDEHDLSLLLQAKAAVFSGAQILLRAGGIEPRQLAALHVAGGFGKHLNAAHALRIGLLPEMPLERIKVVGNTSLAAASSALLNSWAYEEMSELARRVRVIELNLEPDYADCYINALSL